MKSTCCAFLLCLLCLFSLVLSADSLSENMAKLAKEEIWLAKRQNVPVLTTRDALVRCIELSRAYYLNHQNPEGNFVYSLDLKTGKTRGKDNQVRQAGALWGLSNLNKERFNEPTRRAVLLGIEYFKRNVRELPSGEKCLVYPRDAEIKTGTVALYCLALMDLLEGQSNYMTGEALLVYREQLDIHLNYLKSMELEDGTWSAQYNYANEVKLPFSSPYFDGEALLAYCRAARKFQRTDLLPRIQFAIPKLLQKYTIDAWAPTGEPDDTKGFYQWSCMAFSEYTDADWPEHRQLVRDAAMALSWWILYENDLEHRLGNTGYAVEGLVAAYRVAQAHHLEKEAQTLKEVCCRIMAKLMTYQFMGPYMRYQPELSALTKAPPASEGAIIAGNHDMEVRIDTVQHQTHAMLMMLKSMFE